MSETEQSKLWRGAFGDAYTERNSADAEHTRARLTMWARILRVTVGSPLASILEVGSNIGNNLRALRALSAAELYATEPNDRARAVLVSQGIVPAINVHDSVAANLDFSDSAIDLVFTSGVLIHIAPDNLLASCREIHRVARHFIACIEYFSDKPEEILYRGHAGALFKRDFGAFWLDNFPDLRVLDYGFFWKRLTGLDNLTWWIFEKQLCERPRSA